MYPIRTILAVLAAAAVAAGCATRAPSESEPPPVPPIVFVHGNGDSATVWQTMLWRFETHGWPTELLHAVDLPFPLARDEDTRPQPGRTATEEHLTQVKAAVESILERTGAQRAILIGSGRGGNAIRNYVQNGGGEHTVGHAVLAGTPSHGIWAVRGLREESEFSGLSTFLKGLNSPKTPDGHEVSPAVSWLTIRSDGNDKFAQPDGLWIGSRGLATNVTAASPELLGATNVVLPGADHRETAFSSAAFDAVFRFLTGEAARSPDIVPQDEVELDGRITGHGLDPADRSSGAFPNNLPIVDARIEVYEVDRTSGVRLGDAVHRKTVGADGRWGPFTARPDASYEFVIAAEGYAINHVYRSPFPRSSAVVNFRPERLNVADRDAQAVVTMTRPRGFFDAERDTMRFGGISPPPGVPPKGAGVSTSTLKATSDAVQTVVAEFNGERVAGRTWPASENRLVFLELTY